MLKDARTRSAAWWFWLLIYLAAPATAQVDEPPIRFGLRAPGTELAPGGVLPLVVVARIPGGWHLYGLRQPPDGPLPTRVEVGPEPLFTLAAAVTGSGALARFDPNFGVVVEWHDDSAAFRVPLRVARQTLPGTYDVQVRVSYQRCNDRICLPLRTDTLELALEVAGAPVPREPEATSSPPGSPPAASAAARGGTPAQGEAPAGAAADTGTTPSGRVDTLRTTSPEPVEVPAAPPPRRGGGLLIGAAGALAVLAGVVLVRSRRRGR